LSEALRERLLAERDERRRIAELVHDGPVQYLSALMQMVEAAVRSLEVGDTEAARAIGVRALEVAREAAAELREIVQGLEPRTLHEHGFAATVRELSERTLVPRGARCELDLDRGPALGVGASSGLYQVVRETIDQVVRRGPPTAVRIGLRPTESGGAELTISDDGAPERRQTVVDGLAERVADLNGRLETERDGTWTTVRVVLPPSALLL
jgi:signal transduction histidine kinase